MGGVVGELMMSSLPGDRSNNTALTNLALDSAAL